MSNGEKMSSKPEYTVAVCSYNMAETLQKSLKSILDQLDEKFEVLVVDDQSIDGSQEILERLEEEYEILRLIEGENENIGEARRHANKEAQGNYIITQLDMDDVYNRVIKDFVEIYEKLRKEVDKEFYLSSHGLNIASSELLENHPYRSLGYGEDKDLWMRLLAEDSIIVLDIEQPFESIGYDYGRIDHLRISYEITKVLFKSGVAFRSFLSFKLRNLDYFDDLFQILVSPLAFLNAKREGVYGLPEEVKDYRRARDMLQNETYTLRELEESYNVDLTSELSDRGKEVLDK